jgi:tagatose-1,6-bisphosphate aldolase non-catalytic subunit AgaZ/GatZ
VQYAAIREGRLKNDPRELVLAGIEQVLQPYDRACRPAGAAVIDRGHK